MHVDIISPEKILYAGTVNRVQLPGTHGYFELLNNHAPIVSTLKEGAVKVQDEKGVYHHFKIESGVVEASKDHVSVLVEE